MSTPRQIILVGAFVEIIELCDAISVEIVGIIDNSCTGSFQGRPILGTDTEADQILANHPGVPLHITPDSPKVRSKLSELYSRLGALFATLVHPEAFLAPSATVGAGSAIQARAQVSAETSIGCGVKVNTGANVTHDVEIGDFVTIAPAAVLLGRTRVGPRAYIGANATILPGISIGQDALVGAGTTVTRDVLAGAKIVGFSGKLL
ncbi:MAG TPA: acetyltransferase [Hyphomicrobiaceae bacterium]|nr:acetyltransferase [Hyphomicrobiaceae bacterium]